MDAGRRHRREASPRRSSTAGDADTAAEPSIGPPEPLPAGKTSPRSSTMHTAPHTDASELDVPEQGTVVTVTVAGDELSTITAPFESISDRFVVLHARDGLYVEIPRARVLWLRARG